jgi:hypothetical protein
MKILITFFLIFAFSPFGISQYFDSLNRATYNTSKLMWVCDSFAPSLGSVQGQGVTWDYSNLAGYGTAKRTVSMNDTTGFPFMSDFPGTNVVFSIENFLYRYEYLNSAGLKSKGYAMPNTDLGDIKAKYTNNDQLLMNFPFYSGDTLSDNFTGNVSFYYNGSYQNPSCYGNSEVDYDGLGTLILPGGQTLQNVSRLRIIDTTHTNVPLIGAVQIIKEQYEYYTLNLQTEKLPRFVYSSVSVLSGFPSPLISVTMVLSDGEPTQQAGLESNELSQLKISPNPSKGKLNISGLDGSFDYELRDLNGRIFTSEKSENPQLILDVEAGLYFLIIKQDGKVSNHRILIQ